MQLNKITLVLASFAAAFALAIGAPAAALGVPAPAAQQSPASAVSKDKTLLAAAEPFENLTEMAFISNWSKIDRTISQAEHAASGARGSLPQEAVASMDTHLAAMKSARQKHDRADLALSSIEVYRVLVSSVSAGTRIPSQVSLLDYSGFRYDADLKSSPIRWDDMNEVVAFARQQWAVVGPKLKGVALATRFEKAVDGMDKAAKQKNKALAASSVRSESDLVDELENYFSSH